MIFLAICPDPGVPANESRIGNDFLDGQTVAFRCDQGHTLIGSQLLRCVAGKWNGVSPKCKGIIYCSRRKAWQANFCLASLNVLMVAPGNYFS